MNKKAQHVINDLLDLPTRKVYQVLNEPYWLKGCFGNLLRYSIELNDEVFDMFVETIQRKLEDGADVEYEFSESEWNNLQDLKNLPAYKKKEVEI